MSEGTKQKYMNLNEFLKTFFTAQDNNEDHIIFFSNLVEENPDLKSVKDKLDGLRMGPNTEKLFQQYLAARQDSSSEAADFLNMLETITMWFSWNDTKYRRYKFQTARKTIMYLCQSGKIENQKFVLRLLKRIKPDAQENAPDLSLQIARLIATNPEANPYDLHEYSSMLAKSRDKLHDKTVIEELIKMLNDQMSKTDKKISQELAKDFVNADNIRDTNCGTLISVAEDILEIVQNQYKLHECDAKYYEQIENLVAKIRAKYNLDSILSIAPENYVEKFEEQASLKLSKMEPQYEKMEKDLAQSQKSERAMRKEYDEMVQEKRELEDAIAKLKSELNSERNKSKTMRATIKTLLLEVDNRAKGSIINVRKDIQQKIKQISEELSKN